MRLAVRFRRAGGILALAAVVAAAGSCGRVSVSELVTGRRLAHYVPTPLPTVHRMLTLAGVGPDDVVYDLGSGDGRLVIAAASAYGARGVGIEIDEALVERSRRNAAEVGVSGRVRFVLGDLMAEDLREATVVTLYLIPSSLERLRPRFLDQLPAGARVVSHQFSMGSWAPDAVERFVDEAGVPRVVYLWTFPGPGAEAGSVSSRGRSAP